MNENKSPSLATRLPIVVLCLICLSAASQWSINRFVLYHSQNRVLQPSDYTVTVSPVVSNLPKDHQVSDDGQFSVKVMTRGTSHAMDRVTHSLLPPFGLSLGGLLAMLYVSRRHAQPA